VIVECTAPSNRIVINHPASQLVILAVRKHLDRSCMNLHDGSKFLSEDSADFAQSPKCQEGVEGHVIVLPSGQTVKSKMDWCRAIHGLLSKMPDKFLVQAVLDGTIDDILHREF